MNGYKYVKRILAILFLVILAVGYLRKSTVTEIKAVSKYLSAATLKKSSQTIDALETGYSSDFPYQRSLIDLNGVSARLLRLRSLYKTAGVNITRDYRIVTQYDETSTDYEVEQVLKLKKFLDKNDIRFLYVNKPTKYLNDSFFYAEFGEQSYTNRNTDKLVSRLREKDVPVIDLRENIQEEGLDIKDRFYRTDHHWTTPAALWATGIIADGLNKYCGYGIDPSLYDESNYDFKTWKECWLGEQGRKVGETYVGLDDFTKITPKFSTDYTFKSKDGNVEGTFADFIKEDTFDLEKDVYENRSWHYSYDQRNCINNNADYGKVLLLGDSFDQTTEPFLSLGVHEIDSIILRSRGKSFNLKKYIKKHHYDTVIVCYAQLMIGAHDDPDSANYKMYSFIKDKK